MSRIVDMALVAICGGALVVGAFQAGKLAERRWWRSELASRNAEVRATMAKLGADADAIDTTLLRIVEGDRARLEDAEAEVKRLKGAAAPAGDPCLRVPARCLHATPRRGGGASDAATDRAGAAGGTGGAAVPAPGR